MKQLQSELENPQAGMWRHRWRIPGTKSWTLTGHSRSMERSGFMLEELKIMFDAGVATKDLSPALDAILLTHGHIDHINALPMLLRL